MISPLAGQTRVSARVEAPLVSSAGMALAGWTLLLAFLIAGSLRIGPVAASIGAELGLAVALLAAVARRKASPTFLDLPIAVWMVLGAVSCVLGLAHQAAQPNPYRNIIYGGGAVGPVFVYATQLSLCAAYYLAAWSDAKAAGTAIEIGAAVLLLVCGIDAERVSAGARIEAGFTNANVLGAFLVLLLPTCAVRLHRGQGGAGGRILRALLLAAFLGALFAAHSRGAQTGAVAALSALALAAGGAIERRRRRRLIGLAAALVALVACLAGLAHRGLGDSLDHTISDGQRQAAWQAGCEIFARHALFGAGLGAFPAEMQRLGLREPDPLGATMPLVPALHLHAHDIVLQAAAERGLPGAALLLIAGIVIARRIGRALRRESWTSRPDATAAAAAICGWAAGNVADYTAWFPAVAILVGLQLGILANRQNGPEEAGDACR